MAPATPPRLELAGIVKHYPGVAAVDGVDLRVDAGSLHAILGENGAGKSTLMKIAYGAVEPDAGTMRWNGEPVQLASPHAARALGIAMVFQHFSLFESLTVAENIRLGLDEALPRAELLARIEAVGRAYGLPLQPARPVHTLSVGERQRVELVRALLGEPSLLILDEPTSVLTPQAVQGLFETLRRLAERGCAVLYISHKLEEIRSLCHRCTVMRAGRIVDTVDPAGHDHASLARLMLGSEPPPLQHRPCTPGPVRLAVRGLALPPAQAFGVALEGIDLEVRGGEVVGIAGISGNGQQELLDALAGEDRRAAPGTIALDGRDVTAAGPRARRAAGLRFVPEERLGRAAVPTLPLAANMLLTRREPAGALGWLDTAAARALAQRVVERFGVKTAGVEAPARALSGGNLQKFIVGREIDAAPDVLVVAQPTWGVDVGSAARIRAELLALRDAGAAVLVVSEELEELFEVADRLVVLAQGRLSPAVPIGQARLEAIGAWMAGLWPGGPGAGAGRDAAA